MITLAKIDYPIITQRYFPFLYGLAYGRHLQHMRRLPIEANKPYSDVLIVFSDQYFQITYIISICDVIYMIAIR